MKVRSGFVSNSSSSSFIIEEISAWDKNLNVQNVLETVKTMVRVYRDKNLSETLEEYKKRNAEDFVHYNYTDKLIEQSYQDRLTRFERYYSDEMIDKQISVCYVEDIDSQLDLSYWYPKRILQPKSIVIFDNSDNFIPEELLDDIVKKFEIEQENYVGHMG